MNNDNILKKVWRIVYPVGIYFGISNIVSFAYMFMMAITIQTQSIVSGEAYSQEALTLELTNLITSSSLMLTGIGAVVTIPIILLLYRGDLKRETIKFKKPEVKNYWIIILMMPFLCLWSNNIIAMSGLSEIFTGINQVNEALYSGGIVLEIIVVVILAPIVEELIFRGMVLKRVCAYSGRWAGIIMSSLFFGIYHMNVVQGIYAFIVGFVLALIYDKYKTIIAPIIAHMLINLVSVIMTETQILNIIYDNTVVYIASTIVAFIIFAVLIRIMNGNVNIKQVDISNEECN